AGVLPGRRTAASASRTKGSPASASEWTATVSMPRRRAVAKTRRAISPRLATRILVIISGLLGFGAPIASSCLGRGACSTSSRRRDVLVPRTPLLACSQPEHSISVGTPDRCVLDDAQADPEDGPGVTGID